MSRKSEQRTESTPDNLHKGFTGVLGLDALSLYKIEKRSLSMAGKLFWYDYFNEDLKQFAERIIPLKESISTEEPTKMSVIIPFFQMLEYNVFNPAEFCPEFTSDVGIKKGKKVDYAVLIYGIPEIIN